MTKTRPSEYKENIKKFGTPNHPCDGCIDNCNDGCNVPIEDRKK